MCMWASSKRIIHEHTSEEAAGSDTVTEGASE